MSNLEAFLLGIMVALTPSAIAFAILLWRAPDAVSTDHGKEQGARGDETRHELPVIPGDQPKNLIPDMDSDEHHDARH